MGGKREARATHPGGNEGRARLEDGRRRDSADRKLLHEFGKTVNIQESVRGHGEKLGDFFT